MPRTTFLGALACLALASAIAAPPADAQAYPQRAITLVNPNAPGGTNEIIKGVIFDRLASALGVPIVMESRSGASGAIGAAYVARAEPDGYTLLIAGASIMATNAVTQKALPYDPVRDLAPIIVLTDAQLMLVVNRTVPAADGFGRARAAAASKAASQKRGERVKRTGVASMGVLPSITGGPASGLSSP